MAAGATMTTEADFLHAIRRSPEDDSLRLVYSDWLEEHGQPERAEFVRLQVELGPMRFEIDRPRVRQLLAREEELLRAHAEKWLGRLPRAVREASRPPHQPGSLGPFFRGGVPELVALSLDVLLRAGE